ncbi:Hint domain-containing protein [Octadecabacter sp. 1_MG-2023]|uniref:Hint domain-containing protein n=1 Tax=unclassified Octadecabacter TaxID=196158 RepID=UPI001C0A398D|nr:MULTISPECIES: Hint domain-containing protein [unclassified Octadecabacter]MBU2992913.1 Hint domain-containing protein [Octadecabacter sp. B2R22]MDO6733636.1 Hint domain-containing protein [Octadecabacter sp. 1_MG-2023]
MAYTIYASDNEFAASTGDNVNSGAGISTFDYPPTATKNLTISSYDGDDSPTVFSVGDTYEISWTGMGGGQDPIQFSVIRSDPISYEGQDGHAVVFEGTDEDGDPVHLVWSPGIDLEDWYFDNFSGGESPGFYTTDQNAAEQYQYVCFVKGTHIATPGGITRVEHLKAGDLVLTLDHGPQPLRWIGQRKISGRYAMAPVVFEPEALGNALPLCVSPQHRILTQSWKAELMFGHDEVLLPARAFVGQPGVTQTPVDRVTYVHLLFDRHEIVLAEDVACESLLLGEMSMNVLRAPSDDATAEAGALFPDVLSMVDLHGMKAARPVLRMKEAQAMMEHIPPPVMRPLECLL